MANDSALRGEEGWHPPMAPLSPQEARRQKEVQEAMEGEEAEDQPSGTQPFWQKTLTRAPMEGVATERPTSDTARLPPPFAPPTEPVPHSPRIAPGTKDIGNRPSVAPSVPGTRDMPMSPEFIFTPLPNEPSPQRPPDPDSILYTKTDSDDATAGYTGPHLGGPFGAINA